MTTRQRPLRAGLRDTRARGRLVEHESALESDFVTLTGFLEP